MQKFVVDVLANWQRNERKQGLSNNTDNNILRIIHTLSRLWERQAAEQKRLDEQVQEFANNTNAKAMGTYTLIKPKN